MVGMKDAFKAARMKGTHEIAKGELIRAWPKGTIEAMFGPQAPITKKVHFLMRLTTCVHMETTLNPDTWEDIVTRCKWRAERGFLCRKHDADLLNPKVAPRPQAPYVPKPIYAAEVIVHDANEITLRGREGYGLKFKIQFVAGVRMKSNPDRVHIVEPIVDNLNKES